MVSRFIFQRAWNRRRLIRERGWAGWLGFEWGFLKYLWQTRNEREIPRSERPVCAIFIELRLGFDITGAVSRSDLVNFARLSGCDDLIEEAEMSAEDYQRRIEGRGGSYPLEGLRDSWASRS